MDDLDLSVDSRDISDNVQRLLIVTIKRCVVVVPVSRKWVARAAQNIARSYPGTS
jgi:hypothetical protein